MKAYLKSAHFAVLGFFLFSVMNIFGIYYAMGNHPLIEVFIVFSIISLILLPACSTKN